MKINQFTLFCQRCLLTLTIAFFLSLVLLINPVMAQEKVLSTLTVTGQGTERIPTTLTQVQLGVEIQAKTAEQVQQQVAKRTSSIVDLLRTRKVERLQTTGINLQPNYKYDNNQQMLVGYVGTNTVSFRHQTEQIGSILDDAVTAGATRIDGISFTATDEAIAIAKKAALRQATQDAQEQANAVLEALNLTAKEIISIQLDQANLPEPKMMQTQKLAMAQAADMTPVIGGEQTVQASVTLQITY
jgi:hypothetical protein